jgi:hypothetical protein
MTHAIDSMAIIPRSARRGRSVFPSLLPQLDHDAEAKFTIGAGHAFAASSMRTPLAARVRTGRQWFREWTSVLPPALLVESTSYV